MEYFINPIIARIAVVKVLIIEESQYLQIYVLGMSYQMDELTP